MDLIYRLTDAQGRILGERATVEDAKSLAPADTVWRSAEAGFPGDCDGRHGDDTYTVRLFCQPDVLRQTHPSTTVTCDIQQYVGGGWRSVFIVRSKDVKKPDEAAQEWLAANREPGASYRIARSIRTLIITVDPA